MKVDLLNEICDDRNTTGGSSGEAALGKDPSERVGSQMTSYSRWGKRAVDLTMAIPSLVVLASVMGVITLLVSWRMSAPALFLQERPSLQGKPFNLCQFRSITTTRDPHGQLLPDVQRFTPLGQLLSGWSLNKLSELINVVKGEMSLVGPRPLLIKCLNRYNPEQMRRHDMKPSITGWCRVNGRDAISWEKFALDVGFVDNWPLGFDLQILALTAWNSLLWEEISQSVHATIEKFRGSRD